MKARTFTPDEIKEIVVKHQKRLSGEAGGVYADLRGANLRGANFQSADLRGANFQGANLRGANFRGANFQSADLRGANFRNANLQYADLRGANLQGADLRGANFQSADLRGANFQNTILEKINWLSYIGIISVDGKARAYKMTKDNGYGPVYEEINYLSQSNFKVDNFNSDAYEQCGSGINLATFQWCLNNKKDDYRLFMMEFSTNIDNICVPIATDGKFRVKECTKIGECDWQGNLIKSEANK